MSAKLPESSARFESTPLGFLYRAFAKPRPLPRLLQLHDHVAVITGSNAGLGLEAARQFLDLGLSRLVMGVRSQAKGDGAAAALREAYPDAVISVWVVDMESYDSVQAFAARVATLSRVDFVFLNAAVVKQAFTLAAGTGHEVSLQTNYLSTALLAILLLPILKGKKRGGGPSTQPRLSIVGSDTAYIAEIQTQGPILPQFDRPDGFQNMRWYARTKLILSVFTAKLAEFVDPNDVLVNMVNPGATKNTGLGRELPGIFGFLMVTFQQLLGRTPQAAASTYLDAVLNNSEESHGSFISEWRIKP